MDVGDDRRTINKQGLHGQSHFASSAISGGALLGERSALAVEDAMFQVDPWEKAADCERALRLTIDPVHPGKFSQYPGVLDFTG